MYIQQTGREACLWVRRPIRGGGGGFRGNGRAGEGRGAPPGAAGRAACRRLRMEAAAHRWKRHCLQPAVLMARLCSQTATPGLVAR